MEWVQGVILTTLGTVLGFVLSQFAKRGESRRARIERRQSAIDDRRRLLLDHTVHDANGFLAGRDGLRVWDAVAIARGRREGAMLTGGDEDDLAGEAIETFLLAVDSKVAGFTVGLGKGIQIVQFPPDEQNYLWRPFIGRFIALTRDWIEMREDGAWLYDRLAMLSSELRNYRIDLTAYGDGRHPLT